MGLPRVTSVNRLEPTGLLESPLAEVLRDFDGDRFQALLANLGWTAAEVAPAQVLATRGEEAIVVRVDTSWNAWYMTLRTALDRTLDTEPGSNDP